MIAAPSSNSSHIGSFSGVRVGKELPNAAARHSRAVDRCALNDCPQWKHCIEAISTNKRWLATTLLGLPDPLRKDDLRLMKA
jgi:hypothetical protein